MRKTRLFKIVVLILIVALALPASMGQASSPKPPVTSATESAGGSNRPVVGSPTSPQAGGGPDVDEVRERLEWFYAWRTSGDPNVPFTLAQAGALREAAALQISQMQNQSLNSPTAPSNYSGAWKNLGPDPTLSVARTADQNYLPVSGRVTALAIRSTAPYTIYLGSAQGGVWVSSTLTTQWSPRTDQLGSLAVGSIALAPSNESIVYVGTGEGNLSGDSYFGNGILKSTNGGKTFTHVSGNYLNQVSIPQLAVDPTNANHLYAAVNGGLGGSPYQRPPAPTQYGIWESTDGGVTWNVRRATTDPFKAATGIVIDPQNPTVLYAAFRTEGIYKSSDGGSNWSPANTGLPAAALNPSNANRFALGISHPVGAQHATLYTGFEWTDSVYHSSTVWKSTDDAGSWTQTNTAVVGGYCGSPSGSQCFYDNVIGVDPSNPNIVYALGLFNYATGTGGIYRSMDGGANWVDLGFHLHPDYHAIAIRTDNPSHIVVGNDGGVWSSSNYGGRLNPGDPTTAVNWNNLNGHINGVTGTVISRTGLAITQFNSMRQNPTLPNRIYAGAQDNGTQRRNSTTPTWVDVSSGDGGQVLVDPFAPQYVYGTYFGLSPFRFDNAGLAIFSNATKTTGINTADRSMFYIPFEMDPSQTARLYLGSYRIYRTDNRGDLWTPISSDLTTGCPSSSSSPTLFACVITAIGVTASGPYLYVGTGDGLVWYSGNADAAAPTWTPVTKAPLPTRPVSSIAVDNSNNQVAYVAYSGFNAATPSQPGHIFSTHDGGQTWVNISGDLPDVPVNSLKMDPLNAQVLYAGTDVGPLVTLNGGTTWAPLGSGFPLVAVGEININPFTGLMRIGSYGRGAWELAGTPAPALQLSIGTNPSLVGPSSIFTYTLTVKNMGNAPATGLVLTDTLPANTTFIRASNGGVLKTNKVVWNAGTLGIGTQSELVYGTFAPASLNVHVTVQASANVHTGDLITNSDYSASFVQGSLLKGSPNSIAIAAPYNLSLSPASQADGTRPGRSVTYTLSVQNLGYLNTSVNLTASGNKWSTTFWNNKFNAQINSLTGVGPALTGVFGVKVSVPVTATGTMTDNVSIIVTPPGHPEAAKSATLTSLVAGSTILLVDNDANVPDVQSSYRTALDAKSYHYDILDLSSSALPYQYLKAHDSVIWFTGMNYPAPLAPYENELAAYLDQGGRIFMSGMDILDQAAGTTAFVHNYLHVLWDGTEGQNDKTVSGNITSVVSNTLTSSLGPYTLDFNAVGLTDFSDLITPIAPAKPAFKDSTGWRALTVSQGRYKVWFLSFPFEAIQSVSDRANLLQAALNDFKHISAYIPLVGKGVQP